MNTILEDERFAKRHNITFEQAHMYRMGCNARLRGSILYDSESISTVDAWYRARLA